MYNEDSQEKMGGHMGQMGCCPKEFKLAKLEMKEKMLKAKLEFIGQIKELIKKSGSESKNK